MLYYNISQLFHASSVKVNKEHLFYTASGITVLLLNYFPIILELFLILFTTYYSQNYTDGP